MDNKNANKLLEEYGVEVSLQRILEDLTLYCSLAGVYNPDIKVTLPKQVIEYFSSSLYSTEKSFDQKSTNLVSKMYTINGIVELLSD